MANPRRSFAARTGAWPALLCLGLWLPGCAGGLEFAAVGAAASAAQAGSTVVKRGKVNAAHLATFQTVVAAAEQAIVDAGLSFEERERVHDYFVEIEAEDERGANYVFRIKRRTDRLVSYQIDVGWFGQDPIARLLLRRMQVHLARNPLPGIDVISIDELNGASD